MGKREVNEGKRNLPLVFLGGALTLLAYVCPYQYIDFMVSSVHIRKQNVYQEENNHNNNVMEFCKRNPERKTE